MSGNYVDHGDGWGFVSGNSNNHPSPLSTVGLFTFTPATGTFVADGILRLNGEDIHYTIVLGTYTVDANGHGTMTWRNGEKHRDFDVVNGGAELKWINTDPASTAEIASSSGTLTKQ